MSQPTGSTEVPVPQEQAAEAQEDAAEQAEMPILDAILSYRPTNDPSGNVKAVEKFYKGVQQFKHLVKEDIEKLASDYREWHEQVNRVDKAIASAGKTTTPPN